MSNVQSQKQSLTFAEPAGVSNDVHNKTNIALLV